MTSKYAYDYNKKLRCLVCSSSGSVNYKTCPTCKGSGNGPSTVAPHLNRDVAWTNGDRIMYGYPTLEFGYEFMPLKGEAVHPSGGFTRSGWKRMEMPLASEIRRMLCHCGRQRKASDYLCDECRQDFMELTDS
jgi:hypothetical protein